MPRFADLQNELYQVSSKGDYINIVQCFKVQTCPFSNIVAEVTITKSLHWNVWHSI